MVDVVFVEEPLRKRESEVQTNDQRLAAAHLTDEPRRHLLAIPATLQHHKLLVASLSDPDLLRSSFGRARPVDGDSADHLPSSGNVDSCV